MTDDSLLVRKFARSLATAHMIGCIVSESFDSRAALGCSGRDAEQSRREIKKREMTVEAEGGGMFGGQGGECGGEMGV